MLFPQKGKKISVPFWYTVCYSYIFSSCKFMDRCLQILYPESLEITEKQTGLPVDLKRTQNYLTFSNKQINGLAGIYWLCLISQQIKCLDKFCFSHRNGLSCKLWCTKVNASTAVLLYFWETPSYNMLLDSRSALFLLSFLLSKLLQSRMTTTTTMTTPRESRHNHIFFFSFKIANRNMLKLVQRKEILEIQV